MDIKIALAHIQRKNVEVYRIKASLQYVPPAVSSKPWIKNEKENFNFHQN